MFTHCFALGISLAAIAIARRPPCHHRTFGLYRAEILAAFTNGLFLLLIVAFILYEAVDRILHPESVQSMSMLGIGLIGLIVNVISVYILHGSHKHDLNIRGVFFHMVADLVSSIGIVVGAFVIYLTGWNIIDPVISIGISILIVYWAWGVLRESGTILLEMAPRGLNINVISKDLKAKFPQIEVMNNAHVWTITSDMLVFSAHITFDESVKECGDHDPLIAQINEYLTRKYNVIESTIQISPRGQSACKIP
jgi:cobalt-zinc-cadmium efflux system protein